MLSTQELERVYIPEKKKISFKMAKELKDIINNSK